MIFENLKKLEVFSVFAAIKVGDTVSDIKEGLAAGMLSLEVVEGSSCMGLAEAETWLFLTERKRTLSVKDKPI